jgi:mRNA interferase RelE/StbE
MPYRIEIKRSAAKEIRKLPDSVLPRVMRAIEGLKENPRPAGARKLSGSEEYRVRVGDYRVVYTIAEEVVTVYIVRVRHRREVYRRR